MSATSERTLELPGIEGIWIFIIADMCMFATLFISFGLDHMQQPQLFEISRQHLDRNIGGINTLILLTSSWLAAKAVILRGAGNIKRARSLIYGAATLGVFFGCSKAIEYGIKFSKGIYLATNPFFTYYFSLTGIHLVHVLVGVLVLIRFGRTMESSPSAFLESGVCYWHMVDLIWVILFPLLYLLH